MYVSINRTALINLILLMLVFGTACSSEVLSRSTSYVAFSFHDRSECMPESLVESFAADNGFAVQSSGVLMQNGRRQIKMSLSKGDEFVATALSNLLLPQNTSQSSYLVRLDFHVPTNATRSEIDLASRRRDDFVAWMSVRNRDCWSVVETGDAFEKR